MEVLAAAPFIGAIIIAVVSAIKSVAPQVTGALTVLVAVIVGIVVALLDTHIGVADISIAQGISIALASSGVVYTASKIGGPTAK